MRCPRFGYYTQTDFVPAPSGEVEGNTCFGRALPLLLAYIEEEQQN